MPKINVLSKDIAELIAAGEVIERPSSVVKELIENSIDAGASIITVEIKNGGNTYMRITDNGCGIEEGDVRNAFLRHATSKISSKDDLDSILTLGFRGEALASVCAVAKVELLTKTKDNAFGTHYVIEGGNEIVFEECGCPDGTTLVVRDLFYNVPARQKFMKKDVTEAGAVLSIIQKIALSHPEISIKMIKNNQQEFSSPGDGKLYSAVYSVYGREFASSLIEVEPYTLNNITVSGYTVKPLYSKANRSFQTFFINNRFIKSMTCSASLTEAYQNMIMVGKFPACVLMLTVPPETVDVNVHPTKAEVRFSNEKFIFDAVYFAVKNALMKDEKAYSFQFPKQRENNSGSRAYDTATDRNFCQTELKFNSPCKEYDDSSEKVITETEETPKKTISETEIVQHNDTQDNPTEQIIDKQENNDSANTLDDSALNSFKYLNKSQFVRKIDEQESKQDENKFVNIRVIGEALGNYIIAENDEGIVIIDKHAAHERILFEKLKKEEHSHSGQLVMHSSGILLDSAEKNALESNAELMKEIGFKFDFSKPPLVYPLEIPIFLDNMDIEAILPEISQKIMQCNNSVQPAVIDEIYHSMACKAAVRARDKNDMLELKALAEQVMSSNEIRHCPHGRPVVFLLSKSQIEKQFRRI